MDTTNGQQTGSPDNPVGNNSQTASRKVIATAMGGAIVGGAIGGAAGAAGANYYDYYTGEEEKAATSTANNENKLNAEEQQDNENGKESASADATVSPASNAASMSYASNTAFPKVNPPRTFAANSDEKGAPDYTGHNNADPVVDNGGSTDLTDGQTGTMGSDDSGLNVIPNPAVSSVDNSSYPSYSENSESGDDGTNDLTYATTTCDGNLYEIDDDDGSNDVQVLGVFNETDDEGNPVELAVLSDGEELAVIFDADNDGVADYAYVDDNGNEEIDEGEVYDISDKGIEMSEYRGGESWDDSGEDCDDCGCYEVYGTCEEDYNYAQNDDEYSSYGDDSSNMPDYNNDVDIYDA